MKKLIVIGAIVLVASLTLGVVGFAFAQTQTPDNPVFGYGSGMMGRWSTENGYAPGMMGRGNGRGFGPGMMGGAYRDGSGPMHTYMLNAFAAALGLTPEELQVQLDAGETMWTVAQAQGMSIEDFTSLMAEARLSALDQAVADGVLTQEQADWMIQRMQQGRGNGYGPGGCPMHGGYSSGTSG